MPGFIDLHMHTCFSDGVHDPGWLLDNVRKAALTAFSVTDHDTLEGYREAKKLLQRSDPELIPGVELSSEIDSAELHMLAYGFDPEDEALNSGLADFQQKRNQRGRLIVEKLREMGMNMDFEAVEEVAGDSAVGRPHIATAMFRKGLVSTYEEAFYKYLGDGRPACVPKTKLAPNEAIQLIHGAGGAAVLAHPMIGGVHQYIEQLAAAGLDGIEIYHYQHTKQNVKSLRHTAERYGLVVTGGSDFHGRGDREQQIGALNVPAELLSGLKTRVQRIRGCR